MSPRKTVKLMFLCTGNSCRSQMAEGFARHLGGPHLEVFSAGLEPAGLNPRAVLAMAEAGVDISRQTSDAIDPGLLCQMDLIVTLCGDAQDRCPVTPNGVRRLHWPLPDPAKAAGTDEEIMQKFRLVREAIREKVVDLIKGVDSLT